MGNRIVVRGIKHLAGAYDSYTLAKFKELYQWQHPYRGMKPIDRDKALEADYKELTPKPEKKRPVDKEEN